MKKFLILTILLMGMAHAQYHPFYGIGTSLGVVHGHPAFLTQIVVGADISLRDKHSIALRVTSGITPYYAAEVAAFESKMTFDSFYRYHLDAQSTVYGGAGAQIRVVVYPDGFYSLPLGGGIIVGYEYQFYPDSDFSVFTEMALDFDHSQRFGKTGSSKVAYTSMNPSLSVGIKWHYWGSDR